MPKVEVPITPSVLEWAIDESGYSLPEVAEEAGVGLADLIGWVRGETRPGVTQMRDIARVLCRPFAMFMLPRPPKSSGPEVKFRPLPGGQSRALTPTERRYVRRASRLQTTLSTLVTELDEKRPLLPQLKVDESPKDPAARVRERFGITLPIQMEWRSASVAFDGWRDAVENLGVLVFLFSMGGDSCRGFSLWHETAPAIAVNTAWNDEARCFTLFHELGHLVTRTNSACQQPTTVSGAWDTTERWCEEFAADVLIPDDGVRSLLSARGAGRQVQFDDIRWLSNKLHVSLRATTIKLISLGRATWDAYRELPVASDAKRAGGPPGHARNLQETREDQVGDRAMSLFRRAVQRDVMTRGEALSFLDVSDVALDLPVKQDA